MKIKCALCDFESVDRDNITIHIENKHHLTLDLLLWKIHEKIEEWEKLPYPYLEVSIESVTKELKSLLENEK